MDEAKIQKAVDIVSLECERVIEIFEAGIKLNPYGCRVTSELKRKMAELRRDTIRLEKLIYHPRDFINGDRV
jgi:3-keto-L-gulonate-6-phosphate decarboxylase